MREYSGTLVNAGIRVHFDSRDNYTPGWKYNEWELRGVPLRIEIGPATLAKHSAMIVRRDSGEKETVLLSDIGLEAKKRLDQIQASLWSNASMRLKNQTHDASSYEELKQIIESDGGFVRAPWCGSEACEKKVKDETGADIRLIPFDESPESGATCVVCGEDAKVDRVFRACLLKDGSSV